MAHAGTAILFASFAVLDLLETCLVNLKPQNEATERTNEHL